MGIVDDNNCVEYHGDQYQELVERYGEVHWLIWCIYAGLFLIFFWPPASRAGKVKKLPARIETYQPEKKKLNKIKGELSL